MLAPRHWGYEARPVGSAGPRRVWEQPPPTLRTVPAERHPWEHARLHWVEGIDARTGERIGLPESQQVCADYWGIPRRTLTDHARTHDWDEQRRQHQLRQADLRAQTLALTFAQDWAQVAGRGMNVSRSGLWLVQSQLAAHIAAARGTDADGNEAVDASALPDPLDLRRLASAGEQFLNLAHRLVELHPTEASLSGAMADAERELELQLDAYQRQAQLDAERVELDPDDEPDDYLWAAPLMGETPVV